jgi:hypothetical protein
MNSYVGKTRGAEGRVSLAGKNIGGELRVPWPYGIEVVKYAFLDSSEYNRVGEKRDFWWDKVEVVKYGFLDGSE